MKKSRVLSVLSLLVILLSIATTATASAKKGYIGRLTGGEEVPVVVTNARGKAIFQLTEDGKGLEFKLGVTNIENVTQGHIHLAPAGSTGPVVVWLYPVDGPPAVLIPGPSSGIISEGIITADDLVGPLAGGELADLVAAIEAGNTYVNVHTSANPSGEVRGQVHEH